MAEVICNQEKFELLKKDTTSSLRRINVRSRLKRQPYSNLRLCWRLQHTQNSHYLGAAVKLSCSVYVLLNNPPSPVVYPKMDLVFANVPNPVSPDIGVLTLRPPCSP